MPEKRIFAKAGHICMICGFRARTKNKYRELQDHLVRQHFQDRIKASLPTRRPFMCPDKSCTVEGKDWQALMRHYTGKHGILEAYLKEVLASGILNNKENYIHRGHPSKLQQNRVPRIGFGSRRKKRPSTTSSVGSSASSQGGKEATITVATTLPEGEMEEMPTNKSDMMETHHQYINEDDPNGGMCNNIPDNSDENCYHTLEVDDTELAEYPTHLALVLKRPKVGKNGMVEPDSLEETYAFVDLKYFMPISANKYIMKSHVNLDEPGVAFTVPHFPMNTAFMGESDPSLNYCLSGGSTTTTNLVSTGANTTYYETIPSQTHQETVLLSSDLEGLNSRQQNSNGLVMTNMTGQYIPTSQMHYSTSPATCGQTLVQSYPPMPSHQQNHQQVYSQMTFQCNGNFCGGPSSTSSSPPVNCCHDQVVPSVSSAESPSPPAIQDPKQQMQEIQDHPQPRLILPCPMGCEEHTPQPNQQVTHTMLHHDQSLQQTVLSPPLPSDVQLQIRQNNNVGMNNKVMCATTTSRMIPMTENIISVSSASTSTKVIVEAAKSIPVEGQNDLHHMQHSNNNNNSNSSLQEIKELDFSMF